ncbi:hypothetical protein L0U85_19415 [Glycomyces sp. L485]|uniref:hypothetical protein n=1 Tax=Glycomyces sp. L485 TaxID=2909235 RepID=UPI001F4B49D3|nr:hypothetical protein [Glycomyces sp. L485]MCH7233006.1 hypothetical protein [Glycomyces sp. L485]
MHPDYPPRTTGEPIAGRSPYAGGPAPFPSAGHSSPPGRPPGPEPMRRGKPSRSHRDRTETRLARVMAALASAAAGIIHAAAVDPHWSEWALAGLLFLGMAFFQIAWAALIIPFGNRFMSVAGVMANLGFLGLWGLSRIRGVPFGPHANVPEAVGVADALTTALEVVVIVSLLWSLLPRERHGVLSAAGYRAAVAVAVLALGTAVMPGVASALQHAHSHEETEEGHDDGHDHDHGTENDADMDEMNGEMTEETGEDMSESPSDTAPDEEEDHTHAPGEEHD